MVVAGSVSTVWNFKWVSGWAFDQKAFLAVRESKFCNLIGEFNHTELLKPQLLLRNCVSDSFCELQWRILHVFFVHVLVVLM